jgi:transposase
MDKLHQIGAILTAGRRPSQELTQCARAAIIGAVAAGASKSAVAKAFGINRRTVQSTFQRFESSTTFQTKARTGRPKVLTAREKRYIIQLTKRFPRITLQLLTGTGDKRVSKSTVRRVLRERGIRPVSRLSP